MSLDTEKLHRLKGKSFDTLYASNPDKWKKMVQDARDYVETFLAPGEKVRIGDVVAIVQNAIRIDPEFEQHTKAIRQRYWVVWFAEYLVEQVYPQPVL